MAEPRIRRVQTQREFDTLVDDYIAQGYELRTRGETSAMLRKKAWGTGGVHLVVLVFFGWWTFGLANAAYALYAHQTADQVLVRRDGPTAEPQVGATNLGATGSSSVGAGGAGPSGGGAAAVMLATALALGLMACGGDTTGDSTNADTAPSTEAAAGDTETNDATAAGDTGTNDAAADGAGANVSGAATAVEPTPEEEAADSGASAGTGSGVVDDPSITLAEFNAIETGMACGDLEALIGGPGEVLSESEFMGIQTVMLIWYGSDGISNANVTCQDGVVLSKAQLMLE